MCERARSGRSAQRTAHATALDRVDVIRAAAFAYDDLRRCANVVREAEDEAVAAEAGVQPARGRQAHVDARRRVVDDAPDEASFHVRQRAAVPRLGAGAVAL